MIAPQPRSPVALVATVLNEASSIQELLASIDGQTLTADEVVLVDGGSTDGTLDMLEDWARGTPNARVLSLPGANIAQGRNHAIHRCAATIVAVTDAGVRLDPSWLERITAPLRDDVSVDVVAGLFVAAPRSTFEWAMGATVLPTPGEIDRRRFLPSSRSVAFRRDAWERVGGYPEWLDYCEDVAFDLALRAAGCRFALAPEALVSVRPRGSLAAFFRQYYRYARGDGRADLWRHRHAIRYGAYLLGLGLLPRARRSPLMATLFGVACGFYLARPVRRLLASRSQRPAAHELLFALGLVPVIRLVGDVAKMLGYPAGVAWRLAGGREIAERAVAAPGCEVPRLGPPTCDVSVIIVSYNTRERLRACLRSLEASIDAPRMETFVVDNASHDGSADMVEREFPWVTLVRSQTNGGYAYANNLAIKRARGRSILLLNPDTEVSSTALRDLVADLDANPDVGAVGPKLVRADGSLDLACRRSFPSPAVAFYRMFGLARLFPKSRRFGRYNLTYLDPDVAADVDALSGACMLVRREAVEQAGLLDERFFMYGEDLDWAFRIKERGWRIRYNPKVVVLHYKGEASRQASGRATVAFYQAMHLFYSKHYRGRARLGLDRAIVVSIYGRMAWSLIRNALRPADRRRVTT